MLEAQRWGVAEPMPEWQVERWFNVPSPLRLAELRGRVVLLHTFQMLCPACVSHGVPQAVRVHEAVGPLGVTVVGLHTVFEHHAVMGPAALEVYLHENRLKFPIGVDRPSARGAVPQTMAALGLQGTPSLLLIDRAGRVRLHHFGVIGDLILGAAIGELLADPVPPEPPQPT